MLVSGITDLKGIDIALILIILILLLEFRIG